MFLLYCQSPCLSFQIPWHHVSILAHMSPGCSEGYNVLPKVTVSYILPNCTLKFSHWCINHILTVFMTFCTTWILASRMMVLSGKYNCASAQLYSAIRHQNCWLYKINGREEGHCGIITHTAECPHFRMLWWTAHWLRIFVEQCTKAPWRKFIV